MNIQEYISSGVIESYLLGGLSDTERSELEKLAIQYPEVKTELEAVEQTLIHFASKTPPAHLKKSIASKLDIKENKIIAIDTKNNSFIKWLAAASLALLIGSAVYIVFLTDKLKSTEEQLTEVNSEKEKYVNELQTQSASYRAMAEDISIMMLPENKKVMLKGLDLAPSSLATIYWNQSTQDVYLNINTLPLPDTDKQYQLWAIVDGKPIDAGVFEMGKNIVFLKKMKSVENPQAFAVTLEKKGGNPTPTMNAMYLIGNV